MGTAPGAGMMQIADCNWTLLYLGAVAELRLNSRGGNELGGQIIYVLG